jgi:hypothetical protein
MAEDQVRMAAADNRVPCGGFSQIGDTYRWLLYCASSSSQC